MTVGVNSLLQRCARDYPQKTWFLKLLLAINAGGSVYGYWWYSSQLAQTEWYWWPFVPDSPLATTLMSITIIILLLNRTPAFSSSNHRFTWFYSFALTWLIKYGLWADVVIIDFWIVRGGVLDVSHWLLLISHAGMVIEGFLYLRYLKIGRGELLFIAAALSIADYTDYVWGVHPYLYASSQYTVALFTAVLLSTFLVLWFFKYKITDRTPNVWGELI